MHDGRIERMVKSGTITERQASMLRESLRVSKTNAHADPPPRHGSRWALAAGGAVVLVVLAWAIIAGVPSGEIQNVSETFNRPEEIGAMNRNLTAILAILVLAVLPLLMFVWFYNDLVSKEEAVFEAWAQTESNFQRRADLIPPLVETVSRYLKHERETLEQVTEARGRPAEALAEGLDSLIAAQKEAAEALGTQGLRPPEEDEVMARLASAERRMRQELNNVLITVEAYPDLRSSDQFLTLQAQLEGTENRINVARMRFNEAVRRFNGATRRLPGNLIAGLGNFKRKSYFEADEGGENAGALEFR